MKEMTGKTLSILALVCTLVFLSACERSGSRERSASRQDVKDFELFELCNSGHATPNAVQRLINGGANVNRKYRATVEGQVHEWYTPLKKALVSNSSPGVISVLVEAGADVNCVHEQKRTPLIYAAGYTSYPEVIVTLAEAGATLDVMSFDGHSPLNRAVAINKNPEIALALINAGANVNFTDSRHGGGITPLMWAVSETSSPNEVCEILLSAGANPRLVDTEGRNALKYAILYQTSRKLSTKVLAELSMGPTGNFTP